MIDYRDTNDRTLVLRRLPKWWAFAAIVMGSFMVPAATLGQAPDWMLPLGAKINSDEAPRTLRSKPVRSTPVQSPRPARLPKVETRLTAPDVTFNTPSNFDIPNEGLNAPDMTGPVLNDPGPQFAAPVLDWQPDGGAVHNTNVREPYDRADDVLQSWARPQRLPPVEQREVETLPDYSGPAQFDQGSETPPATQDDAHLDDEEASDTVNAGVQLLSPLAIGPALSGDIPTTSLDRIQFDRSIRASLASTSPTVSDEVLDFGGPVQCDPCENPIHYDDFSPTPIDSAAMFNDPFAEQWVYDSKNDVPTQRPWIEWGRQFYGDGITPRGLNCFGSKNMVRPQFYVYGDYRAGIATGRNDNGRIDNWAQRLNLDFDLRVTDTERFHAFVGPLDNGGQATRFELREGDVNFREEIDLTPVTGYFEGDLGAMIGGAQGTSSPFEFPIALGLVPLLFQNGIWMEDAVTGAAFSLPARHSRLLNWANYDATFFAIFDQLNSPAFAGRDHAAQAFGTAWFIEAYGGYIEAGYAYVRDRNLGRLSYSNITASFTRRYIDRISNSVRVIVNAGQDVPDAQRTADGVLLLVENSWITSSPLRVVPYANFFAGWDRPQSIARAGVSGGILRNTGINFETDALNGYPTLDPTGNDTAGGSIGIDLLGDELNHQLLVEMSYLAPHGGKTVDVVSDQYAAGARYQVALTNWSLLRFDTMYGWRRGLRDVYGSRMEYRWKF